MTQHAQQLRFSERENEEESLKFLEIFSKRYQEIDKNCKLFWRTILEECQKEKIFVETNVVQLYTQIWPNFLQKARNNFYANGLTKIDQIVMDISKTRNPHWWGPPVASKNARARAIRDFNPPKVKIIEPQHAATSGSGRRKRKDVGESVIPAPSVKVAKMKKNPPVNIDYQTPLTSKPRQPPWLTLKNVEPRRRKQQQPTSEIPSNNFPPAPPVFKIPALPPSLSNPNTLSTIASLIRSLSAAQSTAAASSTVPQNLQSFFASSSPALSTILPSPQIPKPPHPTPATPASPKPHEHFNFNFLPPPPEPPTIMEVNIEPHPTINDSDLPSASTKNKTDVNKNFLLPLRDSSPFRLILSSSSSEDNAEEEDTCQMFPAAIVEEEKES